jgi:hypothetical protein
MRVFGLPLMMTSSRQDESLAVFYGHEIPSLKNKTGDELREIHQWKLNVGPGTRVRQ